MRRRSVRRPNDSWRRRPAAPPMLSPGKSGCTSSSTLLPFVTLLPARGSTHDRGFRAAVASANSDRADSSRELQRNAAVLYCTFASGRETYQILSPKVLLDSIHCTCDLSSLVPDEQLTAARRGELGEDLKVGHLFVQRRDLVQLRG